MVAPYFFMFWIRVMNMLILAFDQSTKISAYSLFINGKYVECGCIDLHKMKDTSERVRAMGVELCEVIKKYNPDNLFKNDNANNKNDIALVEVKLEKWYEKVANFFRKILKK